MLYADVEPALLDLRWRALVTSDAPTLAGLGAACLAADGGFRPLPVGDYLRDQAPALGAFNSDAELVAFAAVRRPEPPAEHLATIVGQVHPAWRARGVGQFLIEWSISQAATLLHDASADHTRALHINTEGLTPAAARLYARYGFEQQFAEDVMRYDLAAPAPAVRLPPGFTLHTWAPELAPQFFAVYDAAFRTRPGFPGWSAERWLAWATGNDDFVPELSLLALAGDTPAGFLVAGQGWLVQLGVRPEWRGGGLGAALTAELLRRAQATGWASVLLDVNVNNPGAARVYARLGFALIGRRARYLRTHS